MIVLYLTNNFSEISKFCSIILPINLYAQTSGQAENIFCLPGGLLETCKRFLANKSVRDRFVIHYTERFCHITRSRAVYVPHTG